MKSFSSLFYIKGLVRANTIRQKFFQIIVALLAIAMLLVYIGNTALSISVELQKARGVLQLLADVTANNLQASLLFDDQKGTQETLNSLSANPDITLAEVRNNQHQLIALFVGEQAKVEGNNILDFFSIPRTLTVQRTVTVNKQNLGTLSIQASLDGLWKLLFTQLTQMAGIMAAVTLLGTLFIKRLANLIVKPIAHVARIAKEITQGGTYALRVPFGADDEVGEMSAAINKMLTEIEQRDQELRIAAVAFESQEGMLVTDANEIILRVNHAFSKITGYSAEDVIGKAPRILQYGLQDEEFFANIREIIQESGTWQGEIQSRRKNGQVYPEWLTVTVVKDQTGKVTHFVSTMVDITERKAAEEKITQLAFYDALTMLPNRRLLLERLSQRLVSGGRNGRFGALMFIDLDKFKTLNDTLGHDIGDLLLQQVGQRLLSSVREADTVSRLGGDEFVVLLDDLSGDINEAGQYAKTLGEVVLATLSRPYQLAEHEYHCTASIGMTLFSDDQFTTGEIMKRADAAMYQAKRAGRDNLHFFELEPTHLA